MNQMIPRFNLDIFSTRKLSNQVNRHNMSAVSWHYLKHVFSPYFTKTIKTTLILVLQLDVSSLLLQAYPTDKSLGPQDIKAGLF